MESEEEVDLFESKEESDLPESDEDIVLEIKSSINYMFSFNISDHLRQFFILILLIGNFISINLGVLFMLLSWFVKHSLSKQIIFLQGYYNSQAVPTMILLSGIVILAVSLLGLKAAIGGRNIDDTTTAKSAAFFFFMYWISAAVTVGIIFIAALTCFSQIRALREAMGQGLRRGMEKYSKVETIKSSIDRLQMAYQCCGANGYADWYNVSWVDLKYLDTADHAISKMIKGGKYFGKDVPFSCCNVTITRPCVDTRIEDISYHSKYSYPGDLTLYKAGCQEVVANFLGNTVFRSIGAFVFTCIINWIVMLILSRYLHTSLSQVQAGKPPVGWLVPYKRSAEAPQQSQDYLKNEESVADIN